MAEPQHGVVGQGSASEALSHRRALAAAAVPGRAYMGVPCVVGGAMTSAVLAQS